MASAETSPCTHPKARAIGTVIALFFLSLTTSTEAVWPVPKTVQISGEPIGFEPSFRLSSVNSDTLLNGAMDRTMHRLEHRLTATQGLQIISVSLPVDPDPSLGIRTDYSYSLEISNRTGLIRANSVYGAMYGLETLTQLAHTGELPGSHILIQDAPDYNWRGLMIDSGRRFFPVELVENLLDTMAAVKMNVLHLHASDHCRFGVESKLFPELTAALQGDKAGFYTQEQIKGLIGYAKQRGIRVVPEFDIPGHARGMLPLEGKGLTFCATGETRSQLYNDPSNQTFDTLSKLLGEMSSLFEDEVFNIGCDETSAAAQCTVESTFEIERKMIQTISSKFGKTPEGWEEIFFDAGAATPNTIVNAWARHNASSITSTGRQAVESSSEHFYFTGAAPGGPTGWSKCHYDIATGVPETQRHLLLGGEVSMWSDTYCNIAQCGSSSGAPPVAHLLFPPSADAAFAKSIGGMIWPRGYVAAGSFWNFNATLNPSSQAFQDSIYKLNDDLSTRGSLVCPSHCSCDQLTACGKPYLTK